MSTEENKNNRIVYVVSYEIICKKASCTQRVWFVDV